VSCSSPSSSKQYRLSHLYWEDNIRGGTEGSCATTLGIGCGGRKKQRERGRAVNDKASFETKERKRIPFLWPFLFVFDRVKILQCHLLAAAFAYMGHFGARKQAQLGLLPLHGDFAGVAEELAMRGSREARACACVRVRRLGGGVRRAAPATATSTQRTQHTISYPGGPSQALVGSQYKAPSPSCLSSLGPSKCTVVKSARIIA